MTSEDAQNLCALWKSSNGTYSRLMVPGFVLSLADGALLLLTVLFYSCFDVSWPLMTSEDAKICVHFGNLLRNLQPADGARICT